MASYPSYSGLYRTDTWISEHMLGSFPCRPAFTGLGYVVCLFQHTGLDPARSGNTRHSTWHWHAEEGLASISR